MTELRSVPGSAGIPLVGETLSFLRDIKQFIDRRIARYGPVFHTNILGSTTAFSCAYASTLDVLLPKDEFPSNNPSLDAAEAYNEFMAPLYPSPNILLVRDAHPLRISSNDLLHHLLTENLPAYIPIIARIVGTEVDHLANSNPSSLRLYAFFKSLTERVVTTVILGHLNEEEYLNIRELCSQHFNGIIAAPVHIEAFGTRSARASAVRAYNQLIRILESRLLGSLGHSLGNLSVLSELAGALQGQADDQEISESAQLLLVLLSTAVPKALASALSSVISILSRKSQTHLQEVLLQEATDGRSETLDSVLMETLRMFPPLPGGMRQSNGARIGGRDVPKRWRVWYSALHSNRDNEVYENAEEFLASRWQEMSKGSVGCPFSRPDAQDSVPTPLTFGAGARHCKGRDLAWVIMRECVIGLLHRFRIANASNEGEGERELRFIPVLRPRIDEAVEVRMR